MERSIVGVTDREFDTLTLRSVSRAWVVSAALLGVIGLSAVWLVPTPVAAQAQQDAFERAQRLMREFEYAEAAVVLEDFITQIQDPRLELQARALRVQALASAGDEAAARQAATELYERDPGFELSAEQRVAPRIRAVFSDASRVARAAPPAELEVLIRQAGSNLVIRLTGRTQAIVSDVELWVRREGSPAFEPATNLQGEGAVRRALVPAAQSLQYYARYLAPSGTVVAEAGTDQAPIDWRPGMVQTPPPGPGPGPGPGPAAGPGTGVPIIPVEPTDEGGSATPWILGGLGVAVAAGVVGLLLWQPWVEEPSLGTITIGLQR